MRSTDRVTTKEVAMRTRSEWEKDVRDWARSGLGARQFAEARELDAKQLVWWRWKLGASKAEARTPRFLPVRVVGAREDGAAPLEPVGGPVEVVLPNGRVVRVAAGFDAATLGRVLAIASEVTSC